LKTPVNTIAVVFGVLLALSMGVLTAAERLRIGRP
jgi:hypothetical protein